MALIYIVEDDVNIREIETFSLKNSGYTVMDFECAKDFYHKLSDKVPDLILLDIMLPDEDGLEILRKLRKNPETRKVPIIMVTAKTTEIDKVKGLDSGADDYLTKPFSVEELLARLRVTVRRLSYMQNSEETPIFINGDLKIDYAARCVYIKERELHLTPIEYKLLYMLSKNIGKVLTHTAITNEIWGNALESDVASLRVFMATLRKKIEKDPSSPQYLQTHVGVGYRMLRV